MNQAFPIFGVAPLESQAEGSSDEPAASSEAVLPICFEKDEDDDDDDGGGGGDDDDDDDDDMFKTHRNKILLGISWMKQVIVIILQLATAQDMGVPTLKKPENILRYLLAILY